MTRNSSPSSIDLVRGVFDHYLAKFPLLFGYWKRYADLEFAIGGTESAEMVYERGVSCVSSSVDLWANYCTFKVQTSHDNTVIREYVFLLFSLPLPQEMRRCQRRHHLSQASLALVT